MGLEISKCPSYSFHEIAAKLQEFFGEYRLYMYYFSWQLVMF